MQNRADLRNPALPLFCLAFVAFAMSWAGCGSGSSTRTVGGTGGALTGPGTGGAGHGTGGTATGTGGTATGTGGTATGTGGTGLGADGGTTDAGPDASSCAMDEKPCKGMCVKVDDPAYGCSPTSCAPCDAYPNGTAACSAGACALGACSTGFKNCDGKDANGCEVDLQNDPTQCGGCGNACVVPNATASCVDATCAVGSCDPGKTDCNGSATDGCEADLQNDPKNCGQCGMVCPGLATCQMGTCGVVCAPGTADCNNDPTDGCETSLYTNQNCAFCGDACNPPHAEGSCVNMGGSGVCTVTSCNPGFADCDKVAANGCEVNDLADANNCGTCGNKCPSGPNSTAVCSIGTCGIFCDPGYRDCNDDPNDGCEVHTDGDTANCGACGTVCNTPNATPGCLAGTCAIASCTGTFKDCDMQVPDGCEIDVSTSPSNCGACGNACNLANATPVCQSGSCAIASCNAGYLDCDGKPADGCEINGTTDVGNCGVCGNACNLPNATPSCNGGACAIASCNAGFKDCDGKPGDGCEVDVNTDPTNCGACGTACNVPNATPGCSGGSCTVASCNPGFKDCDGNPANGCETNILNGDVNDCGGCGIKCILANAAPACMSGMCVVGTCNPGFTDCDGNPADGCETATDTDPNNCGTCGKKCSFANGTAGCSGGACTLVTCTSGYADCDKNPANGCEVALATDGNNCGTCGNACSNACGGAGKGVSTTTCNGGACSITACAAGYQDTDKTCSDGCECALSTTPTTCSASSAHNLGTIPGGASPVAFTSNLFPATPNAAYFTVTFPGNGSQSTYHPKITLTDPFGEFVMDVTTDCSTLISNCNTSGSGQVSTTSGVTTWETAYTAGDPTSKQPNGTSNFVPITFDASGVLYIKVYRKNPNSVANCDNAYTLTAAN